MNTIMITPKNKKEFNLISEVLEKMGIASTTLLEEEKEDIGLGLLMMTANRKEKIPKEKIVEKLSQ